MSTNQIQISIVKDLSSTPVESYQSSIEAEEIVTDVISKYIEWIGKRPILMALFMLSYIKMDKSFKHGVFIGIASTFFLNNIQIYLPVDLAKIVWQYV